MRVACREELALSGKLVHQLRHVQQLGQLARACASALRKAWLRGRSPGYGNDRQTREFKQLLHIDIPPVCSQKPLLDRGRDVQAKAASNYLHEPA